MSLDAIQCTACGGRIHVTPGQDPACWFCGATQFTPAPPIAETPEQWADATVSPAAAQEALRGHLRGFWKGKRFREHEPDPTLVWLPARVASAHVNAFYTGSVRAASRSGERPQSGETSMFLDQVLVPLSHGLLPEELNGVAPFPEGQLVPVPDHLDQIPFETVGRSQREVVRMEEEVARQAIKKRLKAEQNFIRLEVCSATQSVTSVPALVPVFIERVQGSSAPRRFVVNALTGTVYGPVPLAWFRILVASILGLFVLLTGFFAIAEYL